MKSQPVETSITRIAPGEIQVRGHSLPEMIGSRSFSEVTFLLLSGVMPDERQARMLDAMLVSCVDHGINAPSACVARTVASCGSPVQAAMAAGVASIGEHHGGAGEACARLLQETLHQGQGHDIAELAGRVVQQYHASKQRLPGFGHRVHNPDPRAERLFALAKENGFWGQFMQLLTALQTAWQAETGKLLPINVDGAIAGLLSELGLDWQLGKSLFIIARSVGLAAHVHEQILIGKPLQFAPPVKNAPKP